MIMLERRKSFPKRGRDQGCAISEKKNIGKKKEVGKEDFPKKRELTQVFKNGQDLNMQKQARRASYVEGTPSMRKVRCL